MDDDIALLHLAARRMDVHLRHYRSTSRVKTLPEDMLSLVEKYILRSEEPEAMLRQEIIRKEGLFDEEFYRRQFDDRLKEVANPLEHYVTIGWVLLKDPHPLFSVYFYLWKYEDVLAAKVEPLTHYIEAGSREMRDPHPMFLTAFYILSQKAPPVSNQTWLASFLRDHRSDPDMKSVAPHPGFDLREFSERVGKHFDDVYAAFMFSLDLDIDFSPFFNSRFYKEKLGVAIGAMHSFVHYSTYGVHNNVDPNAYFDVLYYRANADDFPIKLDPITHYLWQGELNRVSPHPFFKIDHYAQLHHDGRVEGAFFHFLTEGARLLYIPHPGINTKMIKYLKSKYNRDGADALKLLFAASPEKAYDDISTAIEQNKLQSGSLSTSVSALRQPSPRSRENIKKFAGHRPYNNLAPNILLVAHAAAEHLFGSERSFLDIARALSSLPANVVAVLPKNAPAYTNAIRSECLKAIVFPYMWWRDSAEISLPTVATFKEIIEQENIIAVHVNTIMLREPLVAARQSQVCSTVHIRELITKDAALSEYIGLSPELIIRQVNNAADWLIGNSRATSEAFGINEQSITIENTVNLSDFDAVTPLDLERKDVIVGLISSNIEKKGVLDFVRLAYESFECQLAAKFVLIGPITPLIEGLRAAQGRGEAPANLVFAGYAESPALAMAEVDIVVNFSHFAESFGRTILEAMAAGRPVIVYEWGALPELVQNGVNGFTIEYMDPIAALPYIKQFVNNRQLLLSFGAEGKKLASRFGYEVYTKKMAQFYSKILKDWTPSTVLDPFFIKRARYWSAPGQTASLRLAYFCWHFPVPSETFVLTELEYLVAHGIDVIVFCCQIPHKDFRPTFPIRFERVKSVDDLASQLQRYERNIVHAHFVFPTVTKMVWPACEKARIPFTFIAHAQDIFVYSNENQLRLDEIGASVFCRRALTLSNFHYNYMIERGFPREKLAINANAVDSSRFISKDLKINRKRKRVVAVQRFVEKKGIDLLIRSASLIDDLSIDIHIYGYGELEATYRKLIRDMQLSNVIIHGRLSPTEVSSVMEDADLFVSPCRRTQTGDMDGIPTSVVESMMSGVPVLTTAIAGIPDLVIDGVTGLICEPNAASVAAAIRRFQEMNSLHVASIAREGRKRAIAMHDRKHRVEVLMQIWQNRPIDVVVVSWNNLAELKLVIDRILAYTALPLHLIVCDNNSMREPVPEALDSIWESEDRITIVRNNVNAMVGPGTNLAAKQGCGEVVIYVCGKEGMSFKSGWELPFVRAFEEDEKIGLVGTIGYSPSYMTGATYPKGIRLFEHFRNKEFATNNPERVFGHVQGGLFAFRRKMFDAIGGFSEAVPHDYTDVEYSFYAESCGWKLAEAEGVLALFNKTRPTLSQRFDENVVVAHPVLPEQIETFEAVIAGKLKHCNICDWYGRAFSCDDGLHCPECLASSMDRSLFKWLSETPFLHRRLVTLTIGLKGRLASVCNQQFQGPSYSVDALVKTLRQSGRLSNKPKSAQLAVMRVGEEPAEDLVIIARELRRSLEVGAPTVFQLACNDQKSWDETNGFLCAAMKTAGHRLQEPYKATSAAICYDYRPLSIFKRLP